jgi:hypothetical protein
VLGELTISEIPEEISSTVRGGRLQGVSKIFLPCGNSTRELTKDQQLERRVRRDEWRDSSPVEGVRMFQEKRDEKRDEEIELNRSHCIHVDGMDS